MHHSTPAVTGRLANALPALAILSFLVALVTAAPGIPGFSHDLHPVALPGATGMPDAQAFNLGAFLLPGLLLAYAAARWPVPVDGRGARWARMGRVQVVLSALAFAAQGLLPLDAEGIDSGSSQLHSAAWMVWWLAWAASAVLLAVGTRRPWWLLVAAVVPVIALAGPMVMTTGLAQRAAFVVWMATWWLAPRMLVSRT